MKNFTEEFTINADFLKEINMDRYERIFDYLEKLRQNGETNMLGAPGYLRENYRDLSENEIIDIMDTYIKHYPDIYIKA